MKFQPFARLTSYFRSSRRRATGAHSRAAHPTRRNRLSLERCEPRDLLATLSGIKFETVSPIGFTPGSDVPMGGVTIQIYQDTGSGTFDPAVDALVDTQVTAPVTGAYTSINLTDGRYFIREIAPAGFTQSAGPPFYTVDIVDDAVFTGTQQVIDSFTSPDPAANYLINALNADPFFLQSAGADIVGGQRDLLVDVLGASNAISASGFIGSVSPTKGVVNLGSASNGPGTQLTLQYDGVDADTSALNNALGLATDLTAGGNNGLRFDFNFLQVGSGTTMNLEISATSAGGTATFAGAITQDPLGFSHFVPFASFATVGGFSFAAVTSLSVKMNGSGVQDVDFELDQIVGTNRRNDGYDFGNYPDRSDPACISGFVYVDCDDDGIKDPGEVGIGGVTITLTGTNNQGQPVNVVTQTNGSGFYSFGGLLPGTYVITQTQPAGYLDGKDTIGTPGGTTGNDVFSNIVLTAGFKGVNNNFGERLKNNDCNPCDPKPCNPPPCDPKPCDPKPCDPKDCNPKPCPTPAPCPPAPCPPANCTPTPKPCPTPTPAPCPPAPKDCTPTPKPCPTPTPAPCPPTNGSTTTKLFASGGSTSSATSGGSSSSTKTSTSATSTRSGGTTTTTTSSSSTASGTKTSTTTTTTTGTKTTTISTTTKAGSSTTKTTTTSTSSVTKK